MQPSGPEAVAALTGRSVLFALPISPTERSTPHLAGGRRRSTGGTILLFGGGALPRGAVRRAGARAGRRRGDHRSRAPQRCGASHVRVFSNTMSNTAAANPAAGRRRSDHLGVRHRPRGDQALSRTRSLAPTPSDPGPHADGGAIDPQAADRGAAHEALVHLPPSLSDLQRRSRRVVAREVAVATVGVSSGAVTATVSLSLGRTVERGMAERRMAQLEWPRFNAVWQTRLRPRESAC